jgi:RNA polymerase sigma-70 factor (ECF subfamily)
MDLSVELTQVEQREMAALPYEEMTTREDEFASLVERQSRFLYRVAYSIVRNVHDAEDVVQEAFLKLYRTGAWRGMNEEKAYLARVAGRIAVERLPKRDSLGAEYEMDSLASGERSPEARAVDGDERALLRWLIDRLPEELRQVLVLSAIEEMSSPEVAVVMEIPEGTVRTRVMRAKAELRRRFEAMKEVQR